MTFNLKICDAGLHLKQVFLSLYLVLFVCVYVLPVNEIDTFLSLIENQLTENDDLNNTGSSLEDEVEVNESKLPTLAQTHVLSESFFDSSSKHLFCYLLDYQGREFELTSPPPQKTAFC
jgi:hypothetical protein